MGDKSRSQEIEAVIRSENCRPEPGKEPRILVVEEHRLPPLGKEYGAISLIGYAFTENEFRKWAMLNYSHAQKLDENDLLAAYAKACRRGGWAVYLLL